MSDREEIARSMLSHLDEATDQWGIRYNSTSIVVLDIRMSNLDIRMSNLDKRMSSLDIRMSKLVLEFGQNKTAKNSRLYVAFRMFCQIFKRPTG